MRRFFPAILAVLMVRGAVACGEESKTCYPGDYLGCTCTNGAKGYAACTAGAYGACICDGTTPGVDAATRDAPVDVAPDVADGAAVCAHDGGDGGGLKKLFEACAVNEECEDCRCESFGSKGQVCTKTCTTNEQCPAPSNLCTTRGVCRAPE